MSAQITENVSATSSTRSGFVVNRVASSQTCSALPAEEQQPLRGSRMTRSQLVLPGPDPVPDFKRVRTKFTADQIRELETLFVVHGPHPTREQRLSVAEKINVPPRTVQVFLQNRRQRDTKNRVAVNDAESAKKEAKESTSAEFNFSVPKSAEMEMSSQKELSAVTNMLKSKLSRSSLSSTTRANASEQKPQSGMRPYGTSIMTLDNIAEKMESVRPCHEWKENIPSSDPFSSPITEPITLDEHKSPLKHIQFTPPPPTALWTRMISSPPTPLSPTNRRDGWRRITRVQSVAKFHNLELACALSRGGNRQSEDKVVRRLEPDPLPLPRARTLSFQKRMREDVESNIPRKRASILDFHQATDTATHACPKPKARYTEQQSIAVRRGGCETDSSTGTTTGDELGTPEDSIAPSSPSIEPFMSHVTRLMEESQDIPEQGLTGDGKTVNALSEREADAAMVLASLFGQA